MSTPQIPPLIELPSIVRTRAGPLADRAQAGAFASLSMHDQRVSREFHRSLKEFRELQQAAATAAPSATNEPRSPYSATKDGFVLANDEIETYIRREERWTAASKAESNQGGRPLLKPAPGLQSSMAQALQA